VLCCAPFPPLYLGVALVHVSQVPQSAIFRLESVQSGCDQDTGRGIEGETSASLSSPGLGQHLWPNLDCSSVCCVYN
jgi:hypothetical protein